MLTHVVLVDIGVNLLQTIRKPLVSPEHTILETHNLQPAMSDTMIDCPVVICRAMPGWEQC